MGVVSSPDDHYTINPTMPGSVYVSAAFGRLMDEALTSRLHHVLTCRGCDACRERQRQIALEEMEKAANAVEFCSVMARACRAFPDAGAAVAHWDRRTETSIEELLTAAARLKGVK